MDASDEEGLTGASDAGRYTILPGLATAGSGRLHWPRLAASHAVLHGVWFHHERRLIHPR
ncbi:MAG: hypothetical protein JJU36_16030 [Phycisphaeraceae bacterium]|nr:hypothetical protein [Phycisphaeraceae bacterium]